MSVQSPTPGATSAATLWANHRTRIIAGVVFTAAVVLLFLTRSAVGALISLPLLIGCIPAVAESDAMAASIERWRETFVRIQARGQQGTGRFSRWFLRPLAAGSLGMWRLTERIADPHARAGARLAAVLLFWGLMIGLLLMAVYLIVALIVMAIIFMIVGHFLGWNDGYPGASARRALVPGKRLMREGLFFNTPTGTRVDADGRIMKEGLLFDTPTGTKINPDGRIVEEGLIFDTPTGQRINERGQLVNEGLVFDTPTGIKVNEDGQVVKEGLLFDEPTGLKYE